MSEKDFINKYLEDFSTLIKPNDDIVSKIISVRDVMVSAQKSKNKIMIFGNGG